MSIVPIEPPSPAGHVTVMPTEVLRALAPQSAGLVVDVTAGSGGHSLAILDAFPELRVLAFDPAITLHASGTGFDGMSSASGAWASVAANVVPSSRPVLVPP